MTHSHPPLEFELYGLASSWPGPRWLEFVEGRIGEAVWGAWLAHVEHRPGPWCLIGTLPVDRFRAALAVADGDALSREAAFTAGRWLIGATDPSDSLDDEGRERYRRRSVPFISEQANDWANWPLVSWSVDNHPVRAHVLPRAGAWAAFTTDLADALLIVVAHDLAADELELVQVEPSAYHFVAESPITYSSTLESSRSAAGGTLPPAGAWPLHADHARLTNP